MNYRIPLVAVVLASFVLATLCAGCTKISTQTTVGRGNSWTIPGVLRIGVRQEPDNLNPVLGQQQIDVDIAMFWAGFMLGIRRSGYSYC